MAYLSCLVPWAVMLLVNERSGYLDETLACTSDVVDCLPSLLLINVAVVFMLSLQHTYELLSACFLIRCKAHIKSACVYMEVDVTILVPPSNYHWCMGLMWRGL